MLPEAILVAWPVAPDVLADIAAVFHCQLSEISVLTIRETLAWRRMAVERAISLSGRRVRR